MPMADSSPPRYTMSSTNETMTMHASKTCGRVMVVSMASMDKLMRASGLSCAYFVWAFEELYTMCIHSQKHFDKEYAEDHKT